MREGENGHRSGGSNTHSSTSRISTEKTSFSPSEEKKTDGSTGKERSPSPVESPPQQKNSPIAKSNSAKSAAFADEANESHGEGGSIEEEFQDFDVHIPQSGFQDSESDCDSEEEIQEKNSEEYRKECYQEYHGVGVKSSNFMRRDIRFGHQLLSDDEDEISETDD